jgi:type VI protein secretion system component Hcp
MTIPKRKASLIAALLAFAPVDQAFTQELQTIGTLTIPEITESAVPVYSAGVSYTIPAATGGGSSPGPAAFSTFTLTKLLDAVSPRLLVNAASRRVFPQARIDFIAPDQTLLSTYELSNILVLGAVVRVGTNRVLIEEVSLDYQIIRHTVFTPAGPVQGCWDRAQNAAC